MADRLTTAQRSVNMARIRSKGMKPELAVRSLAHSLGYRFRLHKSGLPGKPDLVFASRRKVIFVHGCFWHGHEDPKCLDGRAPRSNLNYWLPKLKRNKERDAANVVALTELGWQVLEVWECELRKVEAVQAKLIGFLD